MPYTILTMSRGDAVRLPEWVRYHSRLGFDEFHILLDAPNDNSEAVLATLADEVSIKVEVLNPIGYYHPEGLTPGERWTRVKQWRQEHADEITASGLPIVDALSWRQYQHLPPALEEYANREPGSGWLALIDVDEFIVLSPGRSVGDFLGGIERRRVCLTSFDMDTTGWDPHGSLLEQVSQRWSYEDMVEYGKGWPTRVKSIFRYESALPLRSVHVINPGPFERAKVDQARILHFKFPPMDMLPYPVEDRGALLAWQANELGGFDTHDPVAHWSDT